MFNSAEYIQKLRSGDIKAFELLYYEWSAKLYNFVLKVSNNDQYHAEDIVQSVFVKIWESRGTIDANKNLEALIYTIARNTIINIHRRKMYELLHQENIYSDEKELMDRDLENIGLEDELDAVMVAKLVDQFIDELPPERRKIFILSRKQYLTNKEIAEKLGISVNTVESQMTKAIASIRTKLEKYNLLILLPFLGDTLLFNY